MWSQHADFVSLRAGSLCVSQVFGMHTLFSGSLCVGGEGVMELGFQFYSGESMSQVGRLLQALV